MKKGLQFGIILVLLLGIAYAFYSDRIPTAKAEKGFLAPNFTLQTFDGKTVNLHDLRGKPVFINFWASWCDNCKEESPTLEKVYEQYKGKVEFLGINLTGQDKYQNAVQFLQDYHVQYVNLKDPNSTAGDQYKVTSLPTSFFIDANGKITDKVIGSLTEDKLKQELQQIIVK